MQAASYAANMSETSSFALRTEARDLSSSLKMTTLKICLRFYRKAAVSHAFWRVGIVCSRRLPSFRAMTTRSAKVSSLR